MTDAASAPQRAEADALHGGADVGDVVAGTVIGGRVGDGDGARGQQRFALHQARGFLDVAVGVAQRLLQLERGVDMGGEGQLAAPGLRGDALECVESVHEEL